MNWSFEKPTFDSFSQTPEEAPGQELSSAELRERLRDPSYLPSYETLAARLRQVPRGDYMNNPEWKAWSDLTENKKDPVFEFWTKEYIHAFGQYIAQRVDELGGTQEQPAVVLEAGAGNGRLTHFLQEKLDELIPGRAKIVAQDSGDWKIPAKFPVEKIPTDQALAEHKPRLVICAWMPHGVDVTSELRAANSVDEYILIGDTMGACGDPWKTWGEDAYQNEAGELVKHTGSPPFIMDGFTKETLSDISALQLSRTSISGGEETSETVSFRRQVNKEAD